MLPTINSLIKQGVTIAAIPTNLGIGAACYLVNLETLKRPTEAATTKTSSRPARRRTRRRGPERAGEPLICKQHIDGTHRLISPRETVERAPPLAPSMGITRIANVTGLDTLGLPWRVRAQRALDRGQPGQGPRSRAAKASGLMEAIEGFHAEHAELPLRLASARELGRAHPLVDVARLPRVSVSSFHADKPILWCEGARSAWRGPGDRPSRSGPSGSPTSWSTPTSPCRCRPASGHLHDRAATAWPRATT